MVKARRLPVLALVVLLLAVAGCTFITQVLNPTVGSGIPWVIGDSVTVGSWSVGPSGGTILTDDPGGPLDRMAIYIPAGALPTTRSFDITYAPVSNSIAPDFNPLTPLIVIDNGGDYAEDVMTITIPIALPEGHFAMGFFVGESGELEGMPLIELAGDAITVATMHFSRFIIASIPESTLAIATPSAMAQPQSVVDSGFRPMVDDWQFPNYGSYIEPGGHCAGQALSALWYYTERTKQGTSPLHGRFDNNGGTPTPDFWRDDAYGYRLASVVQHDIAWSSRIFHLFEVMGASADATNWKAFFYSIKKTGEPQMVGIYDTDQGGGHAMIVYKADTASGRLYVADPNFPGNTGKTIVYSGNAFSPYVSGDNVADIEAGKGKSYERIWYFGKTAYVPWGKIGQRWSEFDAGTIGNGIFPAYQLKMGGSATGIPLANENAVSGDRVNINISHASGITLGFTAWKEDVAPPFNGDGTVPLATGDQVVGFYVSGQVSSAWEFVDFRRVTFRRATAGYAQITVSASAHLVFTATDPALDDSEDNSDGVQINVWSLGSPSLGGNTFTAAWDNVSPDGVLAPRSGSMTITFDSAMTEVVSFSFSEIVHYAQTSVTQSYSASGAHVPLSGSGDGSYTFSVGGTFHEETCNYLTSYGWQQVTPGGTTNATGWWCGPRAGITIRYSQNKPWDWPAP